MPRYIAFALVAAALTVSAARADEPLVQRVYSVADLVIAPPAAQSPCPCPAVVPTAPTQHDKLIQVIQKTIAPNSWESCGGPGTIDYMPNSLSLVVHQTAGIHKQIDARLSELRGGNNRPIAFAVRIVAVSDECFAANDRPGTTTAMLAQGDVTALLKKLESDFRTRTIAAPKLVALQGQDATCAIGDEKTFVVGLDRKDVAGTPIYIPCHEAITAGTSIQMRGRVLPGNAGVAVKVRIETVELDDDVPLYPITTFITPVFVGGSAGQPVPFTQFIQQPTSTTCRVTKQMGVPLGRTAVMSVGRRVRNVIEEVKVPGLCEVPLIGEFFTARTRRTETENLIVLLTPKLLNADGQEESEPNLEALMGQYRQACRDGRTEQARSLAEQCLKIDPACFGR